jgi:hypothetical protein
VRAYTLDWKHWLDDHRHLLNLIAGGPNAVNSSTTAAADTSDETRAAATTTTNSNGPPSVSDATATTSAAGDTSASSSYNLGLTPQQAERLAQVPIFISGESLGGGQSIALGLRLQQEVAAAAATSAATATVEATDTTTDSSAADDATASSESSADDRALQVAKRFAGVCLVAPAIRGNPPPKPVCWFLRYYCYHQKVASQHRIHVYSRIESTYTIDHYRVYYFCTVLNPCC